MYLTIKDLGKNIKILISNKKTGESPVSVGETEDTVTYLWKQPTDRMTEGHLLELQEECKENMKKQHQIFEKSNACPRRMNANEFSPLCQCLSSCSELYESYEGKKKADSIIMHNSKCRLRRGRDEERGDVFEHVLTK